MPFWYFFRIPKLPLAVDHQDKSVSIMEYLCEEGEAVLPGTPVATVENYWAKLRLNANGKGIVRKTFFQPGTVVKIGDPIAIIGADGEDIPCDRESASLEIVERKREKPGK